MNERIKTELDEQIAFFESQHEEKQEFSPYIATDDPIVHPNHYTQWKIEPTIFLVLNDIPFAEGNIIKYVLRWRKKNGLEDLQKAKRYIDILIELEENKADYLAKKTFL